jgi:hypothetical protein
MNIVDLLPFENVSRPEYNKQFEQRQGLDELVEGAHGFATIKCSVAATAKYAGLYLVEFQSKSSLKKRLVAPGHYAVCAKVAFMPVDILGKPRYRTPDIRLMDTEGIIYTHGLRLNDGFVPRNPGGNGAPALSDEVNLSQGTHDPLVKPWKANSL